MYQQFEDQHDLNMGYELVELYEGSAETDGVEHRADCSCERHFHHRLWIVVLLGLVWAPDLACLEVHCQDSCDLVVSVAAAVGGPVWQDEVVEAP